MRVFRKPVDSPAFKIPLDALQASLETELTGNVELNVVWNTLRGEAHAQHAFLLERTCVCMETPLIGRAGWRFAPNPGDERSNYYRIAFDDPTVLYGDFNLPKDDPGPERLLQMLENLGLAEVLVPRECPEDGHVVYALQTHGDASMKGLNPCLAAMYDLYALRGFTRRPLVLAVHPQTWKGYHEWMRDTEDWAHLMSFCKRAGVRVSKEGEKTSDFFAASRCLVCHTSGVAFEATMASVPVITLHRGNFMHPISGHGLEEVETVQAPADPWTLLNRLAYCQWNFEEIQDGTAVRHLFNL